IMGADPSRGAARQQGSRRAWHRAEPAGTTDASVKLNPVEKLLVNNPLRGLWLRATVGWLYDAACGPPVTRMLEVGCGQGDAVRELVPRFHPRVLDAFDLDPAQVARARTRLPGAANGAQVRLWVGDAERIAAPDGHYDAVLELDIL